jgi:hypothetical protein
MGQETYRIPVTRAREDKENRETEIQPKKTNSLASPAALKATLTQAVMVDR